MFNLGGTNSQSNALASGDGVIPASPDQLHRNKPPVYPEAAAMRGEQGEVDVVIHVSPSGLPFGVDVARSSGYPALDQAAVHAVQTWRFVPAVKDGQPIPSEVPMHFVFSMD